MTLIDLLPVLFIMLVGLPHGAGDGLLALQKFPAHDKRLGNFFTSYLVIAGMVLVLWYFFPVLGLLLFLIQSCIHFGLGDIVGDRLDSKGAQSQSRFHYWARIIAMAAAQFCSFRYSIHSC